MNYLDARLYIMHETPNVPPTDFHTLFPTLSEQGNGHWFSLDVILSLFNVSCHCRN